MLDRRALPCQDLEGDPCFTAACTQIQDSLLSFLNAHPSFFGRERDGHRNLKSLGKLVFSKETSEMECLEIKLALLRGNLGTSID